MADTGQGQQLTVHVGHAKSVPRTAIAGISAATWRDLSRMRKRGQPLRQVVLTLSACRPRWSSPPRYHRVDVVLSA
jgi:hypothetical protein